MKTRMKKLISIGTIPVLALALLVVLGSVLAAGPDDNRGDIAALGKVLDGYAEAVNTGDVDLYMSLWDDNGVQMPPDAPAVFGKEAIRAGTEFLFGMFNLEIAIATEEVQVAGKWGFTRCTYTLLMTPKAGGDPIFVDGKALTVCKRQTDGWRPGPAAGWKIYIDCFNSNVP